MISTHKLQTWIGYILLVGTLGSAALVLIGTTYFLLQHGNESLDPHLFHFAPHYINLATVWHTAFSLNSLSIIQLGLLLLVTTQLCRVALLCWFYIASHDLWFTCFSTFILLVLIYSSFWRN